jgi:protein SCO1/2
MTTTTLLPRTALQRAIFSARPVPQQCLSQHRISRPTARTFSNSSILRYKTVQEAKSRYRVGPFSWQAGLLFFAAGAGLTFYFRCEKERMARKRIAEHSKGLGRPLVGGPFQLIDHNGKPFSEQNLKGKYSLVYFGFTHCPDICPEELDKMAGMIDNVKEKHGNVMRPVFITCDPARDTPEVIKEYLGEFHDDLIGLTGDYEQIKATCKAFRVYFSTPQTVLAGQDYLVDHSIYFYLMGECLGLFSAHVSFILTNPIDPEGDFVEAIGRNFSVDQASRVINDHVSDWKGKIDAAA